MVSHRGLFLDQSYSSISICQAYVPLNREVAETRRQHTHIHTPHSLLISVPLGLFITYINDIDVGLNNFTAKSADDMKSRNSVISDCDRQGLQDNLSKIPAWSARWEMLSNTKKCHILQVGTRNLKYDYKMSREKLKSIQCVKDFGVMTVSNFKFSQQCKGKANRMLGFIKKEFSSKNKDIILPLYNSLVRLHLEYVVQFWLPHLVKLEAVQHRATKMIPSLRNKSYKERLAQLNFFLS